MAIFLEAKDYKNQLNLHDTQVAIKLLKDNFENFLAANLNLMRVSAPLFVTESSGLNDGLSGTEKSVGFTSKDLPGEAIEIVHSLAKWKRQALGEYNIPSGAGLYTDMNAIRKDEELSNMHSIYVDQWDWERHIDKSERHVKFLRKIVHKIYAAFKSTEHLVKQHYPHLPLSLPEDITFITSQELEDLYPDLTPKGREDAICQKHGAVFIIGVGGTLNSGQIHDGRAPDYDDWELNGDLLFWYDQLSIALEMSSMGIRVDKEALKKQLKIANAEDRIPLDYHQKLLNDELPYSIGGGIGQSRMCMFFLNKVHIGQVQASLWDEKTKQIAEEKGIKLL